MSEALITVVVPTYNRADMLREALQSLVRQKTEGIFSFEIIVVNNASTDHTEVILKGFQEKYPNLLRYVYEARKGVANAMNRGVKEARGEWLAFFDDDELTDEDWLRQLYEVAMRTGAPVVGGRVIPDLPGDELLELGGFCRKVLRENDFYATEHVYEGKKLPGTCNVLAARRVFDYIGLFDVDSIGLFGGADPDLFMRARAAGMALVYTPNAVVRHRIPHSRLAACHLKYDSLQIGIVLAYLDHSHEGRWKMLFFLVARIGQAILINLPMLCIAVMRRNTKDLRDRRYQLWQAIGYTRKALSFISSRLFAQEDFFARLNFREGRKMEGTPGRQSEDNESNVL
jgi:glycosyltransferase involved in cell wall biosynthesis